MGLMTPQTPLAIVACLVLFAGCIADPGATPDPDTAPYVHDAETLVAAMDGATVVDAASSSPSQDAQVRDAQLPDADAVECRDGWRIVGRVQLPGAPRDIEVYGNRVYAVVPPAGLVIVSVSEPRAPQMQSVFNIPGAYALALSPTQPWGVVATQGDGAIATHGDGVRVIDISTADAPIETGTLDLREAGVDYAHDIALRGETAFVAAASQGFWRVDVSNRARPHAIDGCCGTNGGVFTGPRGIARVGREVFLADSEAGLITVGVDEDAPIGRIASIALPGAAQAVEVVHALLYVLVDDDRIFSIRRRRRDAFELEAEIEVPAPATALHAADTLLVGTGDGVWQVADGIASKLIDLNGRAATSMKVIGSTMYVGFENGLAVAERDCH